MLPQLAQVNADLATLKFKSGAAGTDSIVVATNDGRGGTDNQVIAVTITTPPPAPAFIHAADQLGTGSITDLSAGQAIAATTAELDSHVLGGFGGAGALASSIDVTDQSLAGAVKAYSAGEGLGAPTLSDVAANRTIGGATQSDFQLPGAQLGDMLSKYA